MQSFPRFLAVFTPFFLSISLLQAETIPFSYRQQLIWIQVNVPNSDRPLHFLLDSGAGATVIETTVARRLGWRFGRSQAVQGVGGGTTGRWITGVRASAGSTPLPDQMLAMNLAGFGRSIGATVDGIIGADFFKRRAVTINWARGTLDLAPRSNPSPGARTVPMRMREGIMCVALEINGQKDQWLRLDTGCAESLLWAPGAEIARSAGISVAFGKNPTTHTQASVRLGEAWTGPVSTGVRGMRIFAGEAGLMGTPFLRKFAIVTIDASAKRLILQ